MRQRFDKILVFLTLLLIQAHIAYAEATTKEEIQIFLEAAGSFLITSVGPGIIAIGIIMAGISMSLGNEQGMRQGGLAIAGGILIMLSKSILDLLKSLTGY